MRVLVACEYSGKVRDAFIGRGHYAMSCDLLETEKPGPHYHGGVEKILAGILCPTCEGLGRYSGKVCNFCGGEKTIHWDLMIAHPPCTHLAVSGARWFKDKQKEQAEALDFVHLLMDAQIPRICIENPISIISSRIRKPDQIIQPWQFGHGETKATCLWLKNLPLLKPTNIVLGREARVHKMPPGPDRWKERSRTFQGIADAMAEQWGNADGGKP